MSTDTLGCPKCGSISFLTPSCDWACGSRVDQFQGFRQSDGCKTLAQMQVPASEPAAPSSAAAERCPTIDLESALRLADEAERVACEANPGPWTYDQPCSPYDPMGHCIVSAAGYAVAAMMMTSDLDDDIKEQASKNGPFIAHARTSVPALASTVRGLVERVRELERERTEAMLDAAALRAEMETEDA